MRVSNVHELKAGDVLARPVHTHNHIAILNSGTVLTDNYIKRLIELNIKSVFIDFEPETVREVKKKAVKVPSEMKQFIYDHLYYMLQNNTTPVFASDERTLNLLKRRYLNAIIEITNEPQLVDLLFKLYSWDERRFDHCAKVSILSSVIGIACNYDHAKFLELVAGSLLYDIGMTAMPHAGEARRSGAEQEAYLLRQHTLIGYRVLQQIDGISERMAQCALLHHERFDGSGYPHRLSGGDIPDYAQIIGMCDLYYEFLSSGTNRGPYTAEEVIEFFYAAGNFYFRADLVQLLLEHVSAYPVTAVLKLSSGQTGIVQSYSSKLLHRPVVRIIEEANGARVASPYELDLATTRNVTVMQVRMQQSSVS